MPGQIAGAPPIPPDKKDEYSRVFRAIFTDHPPIIPFGVPQQFASGPLSRIQTPSPTTYHSAHVHRVAERKRKQVSESALGV